MPEESLPPDGADTWVMSAYLTRRCVCLCGGAFVCGGALWGLWGLWGAFVVGGMDRPGSKL